MQALAAEWPGFATRTISINSKARNGESNEGCNDEDVGRGILLFKCCPPCCRNLEKLSFVSDQIDIGAANSARQLNGIGAGNLAIAFPAASD